MEVQTQAWKIRSIITQTSKREVTWLHYRLLTQMDVWTLHHMNSRWSKYWEYTFQIASP